MKLRGRRWRKRWSMTRPIVWTSRSAARAPSRSTSKTMVRAMNGVETTAEILRHYPECKIIILSMFDDENSVVSAIRSGARACIRKKAPDGDLLDALRMVARGGAYLSPQVSDRLLPRIQK